MNKEKKSATSIAASILILSLLSVALAEPVGAQTAEQLRQFQNLTPDQRAAILKALEVPESDQDAAISEPTVVSPRRVELPPFENTEVDDDYGIAGIDGMEGKEDRETAGRIAEHERIISFRNILIHGYAEIELRLVWDILQSKLPNLLGQVQSLLDEG